MYFGSPSDPSQTAATKMKPRYKGPVRPLSSEAKTSCVYSILKPHGQSSKYQVRVGPKQLYALAHLGCTREAGTSQYISNLKNLRDHFDASFLCCRAHYQAESSCSAAAGCCCCYTIFVLSGRNDRDRSALHSWFSAHLFHVLCRRFRSQIDLLQKGHIRATKAIERSYQTFRLMILKNIHCTD